MPEDGRAVPNGPCTDPEFDRCRWLAGIASALAGERASLEEGTWLLWEE